MVEYWGNEKWRIAFDSPVFHHFRQCSIIPVLQHSTMPEGWLFQLKSGSCLSDAPYAGGAIVYDFPRPFNFLRERARAAGGGSPTSCLR